MSITSQFNLTFLSKDIEKHRKDILDLTLLDVDVDAAKHDKFKIVSNYVCPDPKHAAALARIVDDPTVEIEVDMEKLKAFQANQQAQLATINEIIHKLELRATPKS